MTQCKLCTRGGGGSQQREVADGADVVFTDTGFQAYRRGPHNRAMGDMRLVRLRLMRLAHV